MKDKVEELVKLVSLPSMEEKNEREREGGKRVLQTRISLYWALHSFYFYAFGIWMLGAKF